MKKIAIVAAPNMRYVNTGMVTVELSAKAFVEKHFPDHKVDFYSIVPPDPPGNESWMMMDVGYVQNSSNGIPEIFQHKEIYLNKDELFASDVILYWGDFLQAKHYIETECVQRISKVYGVDKKTALKEAYNALLMVGEPEAIKNRTIMFGGSLLYNTASDYIKGSYGKNISSMVAGCAGIFMRDPISSIRISHLKNDYKESYLGIDPAFLLRDDDFDILPTSAWSEGLRNKGSAGLFFGARTAPTKNLVSFSRAIAKEMNVEQEWLPWFPYHKILRKHNMHTKWSSKGREKWRWINEIEGLLPRGEIYLQGDLLSVLSKYRYVITDTYHLCINSWRAGVPAICFGSEDNSSSKVIKDFKKKILYEMYDANEWYFDISELREKGGERKTIDKIIKLLDNEEMIDVIVGRIRAHSGEMEKILKHSMNKILEKD